MGYYTERQGIRKNKEQKTYKISDEVYALIFDCCEDFYLNISHSFPEECPDGRGYCGIDKKKLYRHLKYEIPNLYKNHQGEIDKNICGASYNPSDVFDIFAIFDLVEFFYKHIRDYKTNDYHKFFNHHHLYFYNSSNSKDTFRGRINAIFEKTGLMYTLTKKGFVEREVEHSMFTPETEKNITQIRKIGLKELLLEAKEIFLHPHPKARKDAVEKTWDALERLKTYYADLDKKQSSNKIIEAMSGGQVKFKELFENEFKTLTDIGNEFRIRHHETNTTDITDDRYYDYLFNRCMALIALAIQYLK